jgi:hypothetical protein
MYLITIIQYKRILNFAHLQKGDRLINGKKVVLVMDEVDGMSAGDRGGAAEMAKLIKKSKVRISLNTPMSWFPHLTFPLPIRSLSFVSVMITKPKKSSHCCEYAMKPSLRGRIGVIKHLP